MSVGISISTIDMAKKDLLYAQVISRDNLIWAWDSVRHDSEDDYVPDIFRYDDIGYNLEELINIIYNGLSHEYYQALPLKHTDVPKTTLAVRPGSVPEVEDRIVSYAIVNIIAPIIDKRLSENVYSFRVKKDYKASKSGLSEERKEIPFLKKKTLQRVRLIKDWFYEWPEFYEISKHIYEEEGYNFLTISDISSYFENINHEILRDHLLSLLPNNQKTVNLLMEVLGRWVWRSGTSRRLGRGIPQRNEVSSFLGNIFLMHLDEKLKAYSKDHDIKPIRYMDDVMIFSKSPDIARDVLFVVNDALRDLYLNVQGAKIQILEGKDIEKEFFPPGMEELNKTIDKIIERLQKRRVSPSVKKDLEKELKKHFVKISKKKAWGKHEWRLFSRLLTGFKIIKSKVALKRCIEEIKRNPDEMMNRKINNYLKLFSDDRKIGEKIEDFLLSNINKFKFQEACLFLLYRYLDEIPMRIFDYMKSVAFDEKRHFFNRCAALVALGSTKLDPKMLNELKSLYAKETNIDVRRAIALCLAQLDKNNLLGFIKMLNGSFERQLTCVGKYYEKIVFDKDNLAQELISTMKKVPVSSDFYKEHFYAFYLLTKIDKKPIKQDLAKLLNRNYVEMKEGKFKEQIKYLYKELTHIGLD